ncbi:hypothetical protein CCACVL1_17310 [Corchorus capsularis]|uniref:Uncharacterized protein n=1 Tax=Corchorus capsularis TaxID=210143 RepID=A0A1R3HSR0_COCAP|nr:hypothetical protein CCACVL1_17310 [Corchorus capsularis]
MALKLNPMDAVTKEPHHTCKLRTCKYDPNHFWTLSSKLVTSVDMAL